MHSIYIKYTSHNHKQLMKSGGSSSDHYFIYLFFGFFRGIHAFYLQQQWHVKITLRAFKCLEGIRFSRKGEETGLGKRTIYKEENYRLLKLNFR